MTQCWNERSRSWCFKVSYVIKVRAVVSCYLCSFSVFLLPYVWGKWCRFWVICCTNDGLDQLVTGSCWDWNAGIPTMWSNWTCMSISFVRCTATFALTLSSWSWKLRRLNRLLLSLSPSTPTLQQHSQQGHGPQPSTIQGPSKRSSLDV